MNFQARGLLFAAIVALPTVFAVPDPGLEDARDQVVADNPWIAPAVPCNEESVLWTGLGAPALDAALAASHGELCEKLSLAAHIQLVRSAGLGGGVSDDGVLSLRVVFPLVETPILTPFRNQNPDSPSFVVDAARDAAAPLDEWLPIMLDPNGEVPCAEGTTGLEQDPYVQAPSLSWGVQVATCRDAGISAALPGDGPDHLARVGGTTVPAPRRIGTVQRLFLVEVTGVAPDVSGGVEQVYERAFLNLALVDNMATESLVGLQAEIERHGASLQETLFEVRAYVTEAAFAAGDAILTHAPVDLPPTSDARFILLEPPAGWGARSATPEAASAMSAAEDGECHATQDGSRYHFTYDNGCATTSASLFESPSSSRSSQCERYRWSCLRHVDHQEGTDYGNYGSTMVERIGAHTWIELPPLAGKGKVTIAGVKASMPVWFKVDVEHPLTITSVWRMDGDVRRLCDSSGGYCQPGGAFLDMRSWVEHWGPGASPSFVGEAKGSVLPSAPLEYCEADIPFAPDFWMLISIPYCFIRDVSGGWKGEADGSNQRILEQTIVVDPRQHQGYFRPSSTLTATLRGTSDRSIPSFSDVHLEFLWFVVGPA